MASVDSLTSRQKNATELAEGHYNRIDNDNMQLHQENKLLNQQIGELRRSTADRESKINQLLDEAKPCLSLPALPIARLPAACHALACLAHRLQHVVHDGWRAVACLAPSGCWTRMRDMYQVSNLRAHMDGMKKKMSRTKDIESLNLGEFEGLMNTNLQVCPWLGRPTHRPSLAVQSLGIDTPSDTSPVWHHICSGGTIDPVVDAQPEGQPR